jgi:excisionase family DNA binding protein
MKLEDRKAAEEDRLIEQHKGNTGAIRIRHQSSFGSNLIFENRVAFSVSDAAFLLGLSNRTVERMVQRGELRVRRVGRRTLIPKDELGAWLNRKE